MRTVPRSVPLAVCLVLGAAGLVAAASLTAAAIAHRWALDALRTNASAAVGFGAARQATGVESVVDARRRRLDAFMATARSRCGYVLEGGGMLWSLSCLTPLVKDFHAAQRTLGVHVIRGVRPVLQYGAPVSIDVAPASSPELPILISAPAGPPRYQLRGIERGLVVVAEYPFDDVAATLAETAPGPGWQSWLVDRDGRVIAAPSGASAAAAGALTPCTGGEVDGEVAAPGGQGLLRAVRPVPGLDACVEARLPLAPALAAADGLRGTLRRLGFVLAVVAGFAAFLVSRWVTTPAHRLAAAVAAVSKGEADRAIVPSGPSELQALGEAMQTLSSDVARRANDAEIARREAEAASAAKDQFVAMLSQELRSLVTTVNEWIRDVPGTQASRQ
jgi:hypothetical protein